MTLPIFCTKVINSLLHHHQLGEVVICCPSYVRSDEPTTRRIAIRPALPYIVVPGVVDRVGIRATDSLLAIRFSTSSRRMRLIRTRV